MTNPNEVTQPLQGLADYLRGIADILPTEGRDLAKKLNAWAKEVEAAQSRTSATSDAARFVAMVTATLNPGSFEYLYLLNQPEPKTIDDVRAQVDAAIAAGGSQNG